ncbi:HlyD family type I secretion periplasmic adaptor subunit [Sphingobium sp. SCG-1]|uniref:HlyD family type I secretion periplasmic adaptor subunit n=1 Tax=Sphingobium sp. SCG-1 TaxID=2072936 RepID=UPI000CD681B1|nr:HlyD family type I secretion periplasmic adaptor subunit [Sphingobium sp. SCG-1]AUW57370.1 HlyD family type I secretion periplasmic adaptor subunit [Sphingobium sp. SCG-1]
MTALASTWASVREALRDEKANAARLSRTDEFDFLPAAIEIVERPVSPTARITARVLMIGLVLTLLWLVFGKLDVVASAPGRLIPADNVKVIQAADSGTVRAILVHDSQAVRKGQPLVELDPTVSSAEAVQAQKALETAELDAARGRAMLSSLNGNGLRFVAPQGTPDDVTAMQTALARAELEAIRGGASTRGADRQAATAALGEARLQAAKLTETLPLVEQQIAANEAMLAKGFVSKLRVIEMQRQRLSIVKDREIALETADKARAQMASASGAQTESDALARAKILDNLTKAEAEARLRREELIKARRKSSLQRLVSPVDGTVAQLSVHTVGGVVEVAKPIMLIVPAGGDLIAEVKILNRDVGFVRVGQSVAVKLTAFPFTRYGTAPGIVQSISSDAVQDEKLGFVYIARVALDRHWGGRSERRIALNPGMEVTADIRTGQRRIGSYLLSPIQAASQEAGRER